MVHILDFPSCVWEAGVAVSAAACPHCASADSVLVYAPERSPAPIPVKRCRHCSLVFSATWSGTFEASLYEYYRARGDEDPRARQDPLNTRRHRSLLESFASATRGRRLLDVGCGEGHFLQTATAMGWDAVGLDLAEGAIGICQKLGLNASLTSFFDSCLDGERFDVVFMSELVEHVPRGVEFFARARALLNPGGLMYATTPNFASLTRRIVGPRWTSLHPEHIVYFEPSTLRAQIASAFPDGRIDISSRNLGVGEIIARLKRPVRHRSDVRAGRSDLREEQRRLRKLVVGKPVLSDVKEWADRALSLAGLGDTLVARVHLSSTG